MRWTGEGCGAWRKSWRVAGGAPPGRLRAGGALSRRGWSVRFACSLTWSWRRRMPQEEPRPPAGTAPSSCGGHRPRGRRLGRVEVPDVPRVRDDGDEAPGGCAAEPLRSAADSLRRPPRHTVHRGDGDNGHTRRWTERRTTAGGRRSTIGPLFDGDLPAAAVGVRHGDSPRGGGSRERRATGHRTVGRPRFGPHRVGPYDVECVRPVLPEQLADRQVGGLARPVPRRAATTVVDRDPSVARRFHSLLDEGAEARP